MSASGMASAILTERSEREKLFPNLREAEWLILLDLSAMSARGRKLAIGDLCHSIFAPGTTTLRHIGRLAHKGLIEREADSEDKRRVFLGLTVLAMEKLDRFADAIADTRPKDGDATEIAAPLASGGGAKQSPITPCNQTSD